MRNHFSVENVLQLVGILIMLAQLAVDLLA